MLRPTPLPPALLSFTLAACTSHPHAGHHHGHEGGAHGHTGHGMPHRFEKADDWAKVFDDPARDAWQRPDEVVALMKIEAGMTVADLGAGTGYFLSRLSSAVGPAGKVLGLDVEEDMVRFMRDRAAKEGLANVEAKVVPFDHPGLEASAADRILIVDTWHHISDRVAYSRKLAEALRPGGTIYVVDFTLESERGPPKEHKLAAEAVVAELTAAGLSASIAEETLPDQYVIAATRK